MTAGCIASAQNVSYSYDASGNRSYKTIVGAASRMSSPESDDSVFGEDSTGSRVLCAAELAVDKLSAEAKAQIDTAMSARKTDVRQPAKSASYAVGSIPMQSSVSPSGGRLYSIPIATAPGYDLVPQIAITYNSQAGDGVAGYGWNISGVSSIEIIDKDRYYHGTVAPANATSAGQVFSLDGQPLVQSSVSGYDLETARGHILVKIISQTGGIPHAFKAFYPDGSVRQFGAPADSESRAVFPETSARDRFGNVMNLSYSWYYNTPRLDGIRYGTDGAMHGNISFAYESRSVLILKDHACLPVLQSQLLKSIESRDSTAVLGTYTLSHQLVSGSYLLTQVGYDKGSSVLRPLTFMYSAVPSADDVILHASGRLNSYFPYSPEHFVFKRGKFVGDSFEDGIVVYPDADNLRPDQMILIYHSRIDGPGYVNYMYAGSDFDSMEIADCDGDGTDEIIRINACSVTGPEHCNHSRISLARLRYDNMGRVSQSADTIWVQNHVSSSTDVERMFCSGDFLGDGRQQLAYVESVSGFVSGSCYINIIDADDAAVICGQQISGMTGVSLARMFMADIDSDGRSEICVPKSDGMDIYTVTESGITGPRQTSRPTVADFEGRGEMLLADFNSDGYLDMLLAPEKKRHPSDDEWKFFKYNGISFTPGSTDICTNCDGDEFCLLDIDRDGLTDLIRKRANAVTVVPYKEFAFQTTRSYTSSAYFNEDEHIVPCGIALSSGGGRRRASDFITMNRDTVKYYVGKRDLSVSRQLMVSTDSYGVFTSDNYQDISLESCTVYNTDGTREYSIADGLKRQRVPLRVLSSSSTLMEDPASGSPVPLSLTGYSYRDAVFSTQGLGFLGFGAMTVRDNLRGTVTEQRNDPSLFGAPTDVTVSLTSSPNTPFSETHNGYDRHTTVHGKLSPRLITTRTVDRLTESETVTDVASFDSCDNPLDIWSTVITAGAALSDTTVTLTEMSYDNVVTAGRQILGLSRWQRVSTIHKGPSSCGESTWSDAGLTLTEYDAELLLPVRVQVFPTRDTLASAPASVTLYSYNAHGRVISERSAAYGASQHEAFVGSSYTYTPDGRFPASVTDALGRTTTYSGYNVWGKPESVTDHRGNTVTYTYDALGRQTSESRPDGSSTTMMYAFSGSGPGVWKETGTGSDGSSSTTFHDGAGRAISTSSLAFDGGTRTVTMTYDLKGRLSTETLPYLTGGASAAPRHRYTYDAYGRRTRDDLLGSGSASAPVVKSTVTSYSGAAVTTSSEGVTSTRYMSADGEVLLARDAGGDIRYRYDNLGRLCELISCPAYGTSLADTTRLSYDIYGRRISIDDSSAGLRTDSYTTNADGSSVTVHTTPAGTTTTYTDRYGRTIRTVTTGPGGFTTDCAYDSVDGSLPVAVTSDNGSSTTYSYDPLGRLYTSRETAPGGRWLEKTVSYSPVTGQVDSVSYRSHRGHIDTERMAYSHGVASMVTADGGLTVMELLSENALGQPTSVRTGTVTRSYGFDAFGLPTSRTMGTVQDFSYSISPQTGNLTARSDGTRSISESFSYDNLDRLIMATDSEFNSPGSGTPINPIRYTYSASGNRTYATYVGNVQYSNPESPYRATSLAPYSGMDPGQNQLMVMYSAYDRPMSVNLPSEVYNYVYNAAGERVQMTNIIKASGPALTRHWMDGGRYETDSTSTCVREIFYLGGTPYSAPMAKIRENGGAWTVYNIGRDYQGSITHIATAGGTLVAEYSYDPWGRMRDPGTHVNYEWDEVPELLLGRGYTGHEHLSAAGLVIMNARLYDPWLGRFLSPDPYVQAPDFTQSLNRYSYCLNNPLKYTDESGEFWNILIGAIIGGVSNWAANGFEYSWKGLGAFCLGAQAGCTGVGVGSIVSYSLGSIGFISGAAMGLSAGFTSGFILGSGNSWISGNSFREGIMEGINSALWGGLSGMIGGGITAGSVAQNGGGNFWTGKGYTQECFGSSTTHIKPGDGMEYSNDFANKFSNENFGKGVKGVHELHADGSIPNATDYYKRNDHVYRIIKGKRYETLGSCKYLGVGKGSDIFLYKAAFTSEEQLYLTMGHEYLHAAFNTVPTNSDQKLRSYQEHAAICDWEYSQARVWDFNVEYYRAKYQYFSPYLHNNPFLWANMGYYILSANPFL